MLTAIKGAYEDGQIIWDEVPSVKKRMKVIVTFLEEDTEPKKKLRKAGSLKEEGTRFGSLAGKVSIPDDFNEPLDDLNDYM